MGSAFRYEREGLFLYSFFWFEKQISWQEIRPKVPDPAPMSLMTRACNFLSGGDVHNTVSCRGNTKRLAGYSPSGLQYRMGWFPGMLFNCTVWSLPGNMVQCVLAVLNAWFVSVMYKESSGNNEYLTVITFGRTWVATLVAFVLGGFVIMNVKKWSRKRGMYGLLCGKTREQLITVAAFLQPTSSDVAASELALAYRKQFGRYAVLALELAIQKARGKMDSEDTKNWLQRLELIVDDEWEKMVPGDRHTTVYFWLLSIAERARVEGLLSQAAAITVFDSVKAGRGSANDLMDLLPNAMPFAYAQMVTFLVKTHTLICSTEFGMKLADARHAPQFKDGVPIDFTILSLLVVFMINACMQGLLDLHTFLHNPFLDHVTGVPHEEIANAGINKLRVELMDQTFCRPRIRSCSLK